MGNLKKYLTMKLLAVTALLVASTDAACTMMKAPSKYFSDDKCTKEKTLDAAATKKVTDAVKTANEAMGKLLDGKCKGSKATGYTKAKCDGDSITDAKTLFSDDKCTTEKKVEEKKTETKTETKKETVNCVAFAQAGTGVYIVPGAAKFLAATAAMGAALAASLY